MKNCVPLTQGRIYANRVETVTSRGWGLPYSDFTLGRKLEQLFLNF